MVERSARVAIRGLGDSVLCCPRYSFAIDVVHVDLMRRGRSPRPTVECLAGLLALAEGGQGSRTPRPTVECVSARLALRGRDRTLGDPRRPGARLCVILNYGFRVGE